MPDWGCRRRARHRIVHEAAARKLAAAVIDNMFHQRLAQTLGDAAMNLAVDQHVVDRLADIVRDCSAGS